MPNGAAEMRPWGRLTFLRRREVGNERQRRARWERCAGVDVQKWISWVVFERVGIYSICTWRSVHVWLRGLVMWQTEQWGQRSAVMEVTRVAFEWMKSFKMHTWCSLCDGKWIGYLKLVKEKSALKHVDRNESLSCFGVLVSFLQIKCG